MKRGIATFLALASLLLVGFAQQNEGPFEAEIKAFEQANKAPGRLNLR